MTARVTVLPSGRRRFTGTVLVDVSGYVDADGWLTSEGITRLRDGLEAARDLPVRLAIGGMTACHAPNYLLADALGYALECASVEVVGTAPEAVEQLVATLREGDT